MYKNKRGVMYKKEGGDVFKSYLPGDINCPLRTIR